MSSIQNKPYLIMADQSDWNNRYVTEGEARAEAESIVSEYPKAKVGIYKLCYVVGNDAE